MVKKKKILFHSDFALSKTGFGRNAKAILSYLYSKDKYDIITLNGGISKSHLELERTPWKSYGCVPISGAELADCNSSQEKMRLYAYGAFELDKIIETEKPDIYIGVQDFWGVDYSISKPWFNKINSLLWITLDSLPLLQKAIDEAPKIKNYWVWSIFAEKEMHRLGHKHVKTVHGAIDVSCFKIFDKQQKINLRKKHSIPENEFLIGFVFRNQLRKSVPNLLEGFKLFKQKNPESNPKLLLHTNWQEGWNIPKLCKEIDVNISDIYTTYVCKNCKNYKVKPFSGPELTCSNCNSEKTLVTTGTSFGITEQNLNEVYNLMDVYCHPFTSGGQEIPIQEAKLAGLITLVTNYSCGEEMCLPEANSIPLSWTEYREFGTEFIKASTSPLSIAEKLLEVFKMTDQEKIKMGKLARKWVIENFSVDSVGKKLENFIDSCPLVSWEEEQNKYTEKNPYAQISYIADSKAWIKHLYLEILKTKVEDNDGGLIHWLERIKEGVSRSSIEAYFRDVARKDNDKNKKFKIEDLFKETDPDQRILVSINSSLENIFLSTKIISSIKEKYPSKKIFVSSNEASHLVFAGNEDIDTAFIATQEFNNPEFLNKNFYEVYSLDNFSINNNHAILLK